MSLSGDLRRLKLGESSFAKITLVDGSGKGINPTIFTGVKKLFFPLGRKKLTRQSPWGDSYIRNTLFIYSFHVWFTCKPKYGGVQNGSNKTDVGQNASGDIFTAGTACRENQKNSDLLLAGVGRGTS